MAVVAIGERLTSLLETCVSLHRGAYDSVGNCCTIEAFYDFIVVQFLLTFNHFVISRIVRSSLPMRRKIVFLKFSEIW